MKKDNSSDMYRRLTNSNFKKPHFENEAERALFDMVNEDIKHINVNQVKKAINIYKKTDLKVVSDLDLKKIIGDIVNSHQFNTINLDERFTCYRARKFPTAKTDKYFEDQTDVWYPCPKHVTRLGRLNKVGQPILYTSEDSYTPINECRINVGETFALIKYIVKAGESLKLVKLLLDDSEDLYESKFVNWTKKIKDLRKITYNFIKSEFTKHVPEGHEYLYRSTIELLNIYDMPNTDGFIYPSVWEKGSFNVAIKAESANKKIEFSGLAYFKLLDYDKDKIGKEYLTYKFPNPWSDSIIDDKISYNYDDPCPINFGGFNKKST